MSIRQLGLRRLRRSLTQTPREWKATAATYTDPALVRELTEPVPNDRNADRLEAAGGWKD
ncbi:hypothetical protein Jiend_19320 [Micromonospora endophytica]|nr:hypothetical protein Jiend_19320 [Micromonospora endophytica]